VRERERFPGAYLTTLYTITALAGRFTMSRQKPSATLLTRKISIGCDYGYRVIEDV
jgi:hypothetical protein